MFEYVFAGSSEAVQRSSQRELDRFVKWARMQLIGEHVLGALEVVEKTVCACGPLSFEQYYAVCGAAAVLAYVALDADGGFDWLWTFFRDVPRLFQIDWSCSRGLVEVGGDGRE